MSSKFEKKAQARMAKRLVKTTPVVKTKARTPTIKKEVAKKAGVKKSAPKKLTFKQQAELRLAKKKPKNIADKVGDDPYGIIKGFLGVGKSARNQRKEILISKLDTISAKDLKAWLKKTYNPIMRGWDKMNAKHQREVTYDFIREDGAIHSKALSSVNKIIASKIKAKKARKQTFKVMGFVMDGTRKEWNALSESEQIRILGEKTDEARNH